MAAIKYRLATLKCDWVIYITDAGQVILSLAWLAANRAYSSGNQTLVTCASHRRCWQRLAEAGRRGHGPDNKILPNTVNYNNNNNSMFSFIILSVIAVVHTPVPSTDRL